MRRRGLVVAGVAVVAAAVVVAATVGLGGDGEAPAAVTNASTAEVVRGTLTQTEQVGGLISYGDPVPLVAQGTAGTVTWLPAVGAEVAVGSVAYRVDGRPVALVRGSNALYRVMGPGSVGPDVAGLKATLRSVGHDEVGTGPTFDAATATAVQDWQRSIGAAVTGTVGPDQAVAHDGPIRVVTRELAPGSRLGAEPNAPVLTYTGTKRFASVPLDVDKQHLVNVGDDTTVTLPDGDEVAGVVTKVGTVAQTIEEQDETFVTVIVSLEGDKGEGLDAAPVSLEITTGVEKDVLTAPVTALVATRGGGYALDVVDGSGRHRVAVTIGMVAHGMVEVEGKGLTDGTVVETAA